jgi:anti-sigma B factor antagonist
VTAAAQRVVHVALRGDLDLVGAPSAGQEVGAALAAGAQSVVIHLEDVTFVDSSGLRVLVDATDAAQRRDVELRILPGPDHVMAVVEAATLAGRLPFVGWP